MLDPIGGTNLVLANLAGVLIGVFGYSYALVASDPVRYRPFISLGAIGKLLAVAAVVEPWLTGARIAALRKLIYPDPSRYALLFVHL
jgi:hypothetical protein